MATILTACTYTRTFEGGTVTIVESPDGTRTMTVEGDREGETVEFNVTGKSKRAIRKLIPFPNHEGQDYEIGFTNPVPIGYHYTYEFEVYNIHGNFVDTLIVETFDDFVDMIPIAYTLAEYPVPSQTDIDAMAADMLLFWVDPETDWHNHN